MTAIQKLGCVVEQVLAHGDRVYSVTLRPERPAPRFRAGQFLHLALDPYDPGGFWPESRVFSIASGPAQRDRLRVTFAVHGTFTERMERDLVQGRQVWIKMPYGDFVVDGEGEIVLIAGGTGVTAFTAFLEDLAAERRQPVTLAYGARTSDLLIYRDVIDACAARLPELRVAYFAEEIGPGDPAGIHRGRMSIAPFWPLLRSAARATFYLAGPPPMLNAISHELRGRGISRDAIRIDAWE